MTPEQEIEQQRRLIWLLVRQLGGCAEIAGAEYAAAPRYPPLTIQTTETGFLLAAPSEQ